MGTITTTDGTEIFYKDWGSGQPIVFSHGWPLSSDDWDTQMMFFLLHGYRVIAHDRRGHGRSTQTSDGHDIDHYADDLAALTAHLDLHDAVHVGHSQERDAEDLPRIPARHAHYGGRDHQCRPAGLPESVTSSRCYQEWEAKGAKFVTPPIDREADIRCYMRDPGLLHGKPAARRPEDLPG